MKYSRNKLIENQETVKYVFFWGHQPSLDGSIHKGCFSQWWPATFEVEDSVYLSAEHWMMAEKARLFGDIEIRTQILHTNSPASAKALGRKVKNFDAAIWNAHKYEIVRQGNFHKFQQHPELGSFLLGTGSRVLVEASPVDPVWGIGIAKDHADAENPEKWKGENLLGFALMEVRDQLKEIKT